MPKKVELSDDAAELERQLARAVDEPRLSDALREAALKHLAPNQN